MSGSEKPIVTAMILCDGVVTDDQTKKKYLLGMFNNINADNYPFCHQSMVVFVSITNGNGHYEARLDLKNLDSNETIFSLPGSIDFDSPLNVHDLSFILKKMTIPKEGLYSFELYCDDELLTEKRFSASLITE